MFDVGDAVKHKISDEAGIIIKKNYKCVLHEPICPRIFGNSITKPDNYLEEILKCKMVPSGTYNLSVGFDKVVRSIEGSLLTAIITNDNGLKMISGLIPS